MEKRNLEIDMLLVLETYKSIVQIEVKSVKKNESIISVLECAAKQLKVGTHSLKAVIKIFLEKIGTMSEQLQFQILI